MQLTAKMTGMDALSLKVKYLIQAAQRGLKYGVSEAAFAIQEEAKVLVPVDTGNLREAIHTEPVTDEAEKQVQMVTPAVGAANKWGFDPAYARRIEMGFFGADSMGRVYNQPAQPYMRPAFDNKQAEAAAGIKQSIRDEMIAASNNAAAARRGR